MTNRQQKELDFKQLHIDFMDALDKADRWKYMKQVDPSVQPNVWQECLGVALDKLNGIKAPTHRGFSAIHFRNEIDLCRMFLLGRESYLNKQGETMLNKPEFR
ncbi:hypothetical protein [Psychrobacter aquimaris]|uniref:hypothetical protein n=1 Tax=Psychrobacter aquimaris TaxID=292733 RepID=UPI0018DFCAE1|nr:hypothetical protein [Psychrobacter aquimaris]